MEAINQLMQQINMNNFEAEEICWVDVTHINNPHDFYIRPRSYNAYLPVLQTPGKKFNKSDIKPGLEVVFYSKMARKSIRGQVRCAEQLNGVMSFIILAKDYGFVEKNVHSSKIFKPLLNIPVPPLATKCKLADCEPLGEEFDKKAIDAMKYFIGEGRITMTVRVKLPVTLVVELLNPCHADDIATLLAYTEYTHLGLMGTSCSVTNVVPKPKRLYYQFRNISLGEKLRVRVLSGKSYSEFYVSEITDHKKYIASRSDFTNYCKHEPQMNIEMLQEGVPVAAMDDLGMYDRAIVKKVTVPESKALVQYVDLGRVEEKHIYWLKQLKSEYYFQRPASAIYCTAETDLVDKYLLPGKEFLISILKVGDGLDKPYTVKVLI